MIEPVADQDLPEVRALIEAVIRGSVADSEEALASCRERSPRSAPLLNSSTVAVGFDRHMGFKQMGPGKGRPGGCVPFAYGS